MISTVGMTVASQNQLDCWLEGSVLGRGHEGQTFMRPGHSKVSWNRYCVTYILLFIFT